MQTAPPKDRRRHRRDGWDEAVRPLREMYADAERWVVAHRPRGHNVVGDNEFMWALMKTALLLGGIPFYSRFPKTVLWLNIASTWPQEKYTHNLLLGLLLGAALVATNLDAQRHAWWTTAAWICAYYVWNMTYTFTSLGDGSRTTMALHRFSLFMHTTHNTIPLLMGLFSQELHLQMWIHARVGSLAMAACVFVYLSCFPIGPVGRDTKTKE